MQRSPDASSPQLPLPPPMAFAAASPSETPGGAVHDAPGTPASLSASAAAPPASGTLAQWNAVFASARSRLGPPGVAALDEIRKRSGLEFLLALRNGELPSVPIGHLLDFWPVEIEPGRVVFQGNPQARHYNPIGTVHGGWVATLLDSAVACAVQTLVEQGRGSTTLELKVNFVRALTEQAGPVRAEGKAIVVGRQVGTAEARLTDSTGRLYAFATTTCLLFDL